MEYITDERAAKIGWINTFASGGLRSGFNNVPRRPAVRWCGVLVWVTSGWGGARFWSWLGGLASSSGVPWGVDVELERVAEGTAPAPWRGLAGLAGLAKAQECLYGDCNWEMQLARSAQNGRAYPQYIIRRPKRRPKVWCGGSRWRSVAPTLRRERTIQTEPTAARRRVSAPGTRTPTTACVIPSRSNHNSHTGSESRARFLKGQMPKPKPNPLVERDGRVFLQELSQIPCPTHVLTVDSAPKCLGGPGAMADCHSHGFVVWPCLVGPVDRSLYPEVLVR